MHWQRGITLAAFIPAWALLAVWQWQEYHAESQAARASLCRQTESVMNVLVGGVQSHRRLERFLEEPIQGMLDALGKSEDILAAAVVSSDRQISLTAGDAALLKLSDTIQPGQYWTDDGYRYVVAFQVAGMPGLGPGGPGVMGMGPGMGRGMGMGATGRNGADRGMSAFGRPAPDNNDPEKAARRERRDGPDRSDRPERRDGPDWQGRPPPDGTPAPMPSRFFAILVHNRSQLDQQLAQYWWLRVSVVIAGGIVLGSVALAWHAAVRLADAHGRAQLLETETRHLRDLSQAAAGLAHETRSPLGLIRGWTQRWIQTFPDGDSQRNQAQAVIEECDRVTARINQFLAFARPCEPRLVEFRPSEVFGELAMLLEPDLDAKRLTLSASSSPSDLTIRADREMFRQAVFNLMQNAVQFSPEGTAIDVSAAAPNGRLHIEVADRGPGVPAGEAPLLFTPYHTTRSSGTGLGLAIVRRITAAHGWQTGFTPRPGGGSIFWIEAAS